LPIIVSKNKGESKDDVIGKFRRISMDEDIPEEVRKRTAYVSKSAARYALKKVIIWRDKCRRRSKKRRNVVKR